MASDHPAWACSRFDSGLLQLKRSGRVSSGKTEQIEHLSPAGHHINVRGAGVLVFGGGVTACGDAVGMSVDCGWSKWGYSGGAIDVSDVDARVEYLRGWRTKNGKPLKLLRQRRDDVIKQTRLQDD